ncbi:hypothetical protein LCGC14_0373900 [marine sediment metagenome]|uniref:DUF3021 domain-containing protein n=1 Tax=marine sediment metagenome TaxID=412755 RepID=A0A0F9VR99_9ZZZZ
MKYNPKTYNKLQNVFTIIIVVGLLIELIFMVFYKQDQIVETITDITLIISSIGLLGFVINFFIYYNPLDKRKFTKKTKLRLYYLFLVFLIMGIILNWNEILGLRIIIIVLSIAFIILSLFIEDKIKREINEQNVYINRKM